MGTILVLGLAAAVYPQLLAAVVLILTRPNPRQLLWACYLGCMLINVGGLIAVYAVFRSRGSIAGTTENRLGPATYLVFGALALALAIFVASRPGRELLGRDLPFRRPKPPDADGQKTGSGMRARAEAALKEGSFVVAGLVGVLLGLPGPFDLVALGHLARDDYATIAAVAAIVAFALVKFLLIELPIVSYAVDPAGTGARVGRFSDWMRANKISVIAGVVGIVGLALIGRGIGGVS
jgi:hypothetical protein